MNSRITAALVGLLAALLLGGTAGAQDLEAFEKRTTLHVLDNGWTFIIVERPVAPVFSFATYVNVGSAQEVAGIAGLAHMFEHMAFKGTPRIGTLDYRGEKKALAAMETAYQAYQAARLTPHPDAGEVESRLDDFRQRQEEAATYVIGNEFSDIISQAGGVGMNAFTSSDFTGYLYSLPANRLELMAYLESERFLHPVLREFYRERDVVQEERRRSVSSPIGRLVEQFLATAFVAHAYKQSDWMSDLESLTMTDAEAFYRKHYVPANMVTAIVGDVKTDNVLPLLEKYFGRLPAGPRPQELRTVEPPQIAEKKLTMKDPSQPLYLEGYHKPAVTHPDQPVYDAIDDILSNGRTSRLYRSLVRDKQIAIAAQSLSGYPGDKYPNLWIAFAVAARGHSNQEIQEAVRAELTRLQTEAVSDAELARFRTRARAAVVRSLGSNSGLARNLARYHMLFGDWRELFRYLERIDRVTAADIRRVAIATFAAANRTVGEIVTDDAPSPEEAPSP